MAIGAEPAPRARSATPGRTLRLCVSAYAVRPGAIRSSGRVAAELAARDLCHAAVFDLDQPVAFLAPLGGGAGADDARAAGAGGVVEAIVDVAAEDGVGAVLRARAQQP